MSITVPAAFPVEPGVTVEQVMAKAADHVVTIEVVETVSYATVRRHAEYNGLHLVSTTRAEARDMWWLSSTFNWVTTEPGKPLAEIDAVLDQIDGGEWARQEAETAKARAEQHALRERLLAEHAEADAEADADDDEDQDDYLAYDGAATTSDA